MKVDIWSDVACPWCFIGKRRFERAAEEFSTKTGETLDVTFHSYQLDPSLPPHDDRTEIDYLAERKGVPASQIRGMFDQVTAAAADEGLAFDFDTVVVANSFTAHRLLHYALQHGAQAALKEALLSAHFEKGQDIGDPDTLVAIAESVGLDPAEARTVLETKAFDDEVRSDIADARQIGISGVPFYLFDEAYGVAGAQPSEVFLDLLQQVKQLNEEDTDKA